MLDVLAKIQHQQRTESDIKSDLLVLLMSKPIEFRTEMPDWPHCFHVDLKPYADWISPDNLRVVTANLVGHLAASGRTPIDVCAVKLPDVYSIVVKTTEPTLHK